MTAANDLAVRRVLEMAGVEFIDENGGGPGVRLKKAASGRKAEGARRGAQSEPFLPYTGIRYKLSL